MTDSKSQDTCACLFNGPRHPDMTNERGIGTDTTEGRYADVTVRRCRACNRLWIRYQVEYEGYSKSGRWAEAPIDEDTAKQITPEMSAQYIERQLWYIFGGCYWGHAGKRGEGPLRWGL